MRLEVASSKLGNFALQAHVRLPRDERVAYHIDTTIEPRKMTHPLNVELMATQMSGKGSDPDIPSQKQAKAEYGKLK